jgi:hypothetical protein
LKENLKAAKAAFFMHKYIGLLIYFEKIGLKTEVFL